MDTRILYACVGVRSEFVGEGARSVGVSENFVAFGTEGKGEEGCACRVVSESWTIARERG